MEIEEIDLSRVPTHTGRFVRPLPLSDHNLA